MTANAAPVVVDAGSAWRDAAGIATALPARVVARLPLVSGVLAVSYAWYYLSHDAIAFHSFVIGTHSNWKESLSLQAIYVVTICVAVLAADEAVARGAARSRAYAIAILAGATLAAGVASITCRAAGWRMEGASDAFAELALLEWYLVALIFATLGVAVYLCEGGARQAAQRMRVAQLARAQARRHTIESRLQAMQARVEPQFLFNTLACVKSLHDVDAAAANRMLDDLIAYLRAALPHLRESTSTLRQELELVGAYLSILRGGGGDAPSLQANVPDRLLACRLPSMMLLPLVDHALAARRRAGVGGGLLSVEAEETSLALHVALCDRRPAPGVPSQTPSALDEIETRLRSVYGERARIVSGAQPDGSVRIVIEMPHEAPDLPDR